MKALPKNLRDEARRMREVEALAIADIARRVGVSPATARRWTLDIQVSEARIAGLRAANAARGTKVMAENYRSRRREWQLEGRQRARDGDLLHQAGCLLYWAEGSKTRTRVTIANSDIHLLSLFLNFLRREFGVEDARLTFRLHLYTGNGLSIKEVESYWLEHLQLPRGSLRKHSINNAPAPTSGVKKNKLPYGVGTIAVNRSLHIVQHIYGAIQEYGGFEEPRWLDL